MTTNIQLSLVYLMAWYIGLLAVPNFQRKEEKKNYKKMPKLFWESIESKELLQNPKVQESA